MLKLWWNTGHSETISAQRRFGHRLWTQTQNTLRKFADVCGFALSPEPSSFWVILWLMSTLTKNWKSFLLFLFSNQLKGSKRFLTIQWLETCSRFLLVFLIISGEHSRKQLLTVVMGSVSYSDCEVFQTFNIRMWQLLAMQSSGS